MEKLINITAEQGVLGSLLRISKNTDQTLDVFDCVSENDFTDLFYQEVFRTCLALSKANQPFDLITLTSGALSSRFAEVAELTEYSSAANIKEYARIVRSASLKRQAVRVLESAQVAIYEGKDIQDALVPVSQFDCGTKGGAKSMNDLLAAYIAELESRNNKDEGSGGLQTGIAGLDKLLQGVRGGELVVIAARPSMGKSLLMNGMIDDIARVQNKPVLAYSLEMNDTENMDRLMSSAAGVHHQALRTADLDDLDWGRISQAMAQLDKAPIHLNTNPNLSVSDIRGEARVINRQSGGLGAVFIDYLTLLDLGGGPNERPDLAVARATRELKKLAGELDCPVFLLCQLNRSVDNRTEKRPLMSDLRESGAIEQDANRVIMLYKEKYYNENTPVGDMTEIIVRKARNGDTGTVYCLPKNGRFVEMDHESIGYLLEAKKTEAVASKKVSKGFRFGEAS